MSYEFKLDLDMKYLWSGLTDVNGDKIYDRDIVMDDYENEYTVIFEKGVFLAVNEKEGANSYLNSINSIVAIKVK